MTGPVFSWDTFLHRHRHRILAEWQDRLHNRVSARYAARPVEELGQTTSDACDAFCRVLADNDYTLINRFISEITRIRLEAGFPLADVQKAFELFREIVIPILVESSPPFLLCQNIEAVNQGLAYTIHRFSSHFQNMHETYLKDYARRLEKDVAARTAELKESEQQYRRLVEEIQDGYLVLSGEKIEYVNPAFCRLHGVTPDQALHQSFLTFVAEKNRGRVKQIITGDAPDRTGDSIEPEAFEYLRKTRDGTCLPTEINFKPSWFKGRAHHSRLEQLVINLLLNALDSIGDGGTIAITTTVRHLDSGPFAVLRVQDDGKGISGDALPYIFEPFFTTKTIGTSLGLANVKQIAAAHRGRVEVKDIKPRGTAFEVLLPMGILR